MLFFQKLEKSMYFISWTKFHVVYLVQNFRSNEPLIFWKENVFFDFHAEYQIPIIVRRDQSLFFVIPQYCAKIRQKSKLDVLLFESDIFKTLFGFIYYL